MKRAVGRAARLLAGLGVIHCASAAAVAALALPSSAQVRIEPVAVSGQAAPGTGGATYGQFLYGPHIGPGGHVAFSATLEGTGVTTDNDRAAFIGRPGALALAARQGDAAPGAGGLVFNGGPAVPPDDALTFLPAAVNGAGEGLLGAYVRSAGAPSEQGTKALYLVSPAGVPQLVMPSVPATPRRAPTPPSKIPRACSRTRAASSLPPGCNARARRRTSNAPFTRGRWEPRC